MSRRSRAVAAGLALLAATFAISAEAASPSPDDTPRCHGKRATIVGTDGTDLLHGTSRRDVIQGEAGNDVISGGLGSDVICGGAGSDFVRGGRGNDVVDGGPGDGDVVLGELGDDRLQGGAGNADEIGGGLGIDVLNGGPGDGDLVHGDYGYDRMDGGSGAGDVASFATAVAGIRGTGIWASLAAHRARGDGHDRIFRFEDLEGSAFSDTLIGNKGPNSIDGGAGNDHLFGGGNIDALDGGQGSDGCRGAKGRTASCGREARLKASAYVQLDRTVGGGGGVEVVGGPGPDRLALAFDDATGSLTVRAAKGIAVGGGCDHLGGSVPNKAVCPVGAPFRWLMADLGPGNDRLRVLGSLAAAEHVRFSGGPGNDVIHAGPEDDLIESSSGADRIYGGAGSDGLIGGLPGPTFLYGGPNGDLLAAGGGCAGGALIGGPGKDNASFAETPAHPGTLIISLAAGHAFVDAIRGCPKVRLSRSDEDIEGSFDSDVLIGDSHANSMLGQPGADRFYGRGGDDTIDARDGIRDAVIQCGRRRPAGLALTDPFDPPPLKCADSTHGHPVPGLHNSN